MPGDHRSDVDVAVLGGGVFGLTAAVELAGRGASVCLVDRAPVPHPDAASTDISKLVRAEYGADDLYTDLMIDGLARWRTWNERWSEEVYVEDGLLLVGSEPFSADGFETTSRAKLAEHGFGIETLDAADVAERYPAWADVAEATWNPQAGWARSGRVMELLAADAVAHGVEMIVDPSARLRIAGGSVTGIDVDGGAVDAKTTVAAAGAWTAALVPGLESKVRCIGQPVVHLEPTDPEQFSASRFPPFGLDIAKSGWYGFPTNRGVVKIANHGPGIPVDPDGPKVVPAAWIDEVRAMARRWLPSLADARVAATRLCLYTDTADGDFIIDRHPDIDGLVVATGGSGHAFKMAPMLGELVADVVSGGEPQPRFRWDRRTDTQEAARAGS